MFTAASIARSNGRKARRSRRIRFRRVQAGAIDDAVKRFNGQHKIVVVPAVWVAVGRATPQVGQGHGVEQRAQASEQPHTPGIVRILPCIAGQRHSPGGFAVIIRHHRSWLK